MHAESGLLEVVDQRHWRAHLVCGLLSRSKVALSGSDGWMLLCLCLVDAFWERLLFRSTFIGPSLGRMTQTAFLVWNCEVQRLLEFLLINLLFSLRVISICVTIFTEHTLPTNVLRALENALYLGSTAEHVVVTGDSAGGNLAVAVTLRCIIEVWWVWSHTTRRIERKCWMKWIRASTNE